MQHLHRSLRRGARGSGEPGAGRCGATAASAVQPARNRGVAREPVEPFGIWGDMQHLHRDPPAVAHGAAGARAAADAAPPAGDGVGLSTNAAVMAVPPAGVSVVGSFIGIWSGMQPPCAGVIARSHRRFRPVPPDGLAGHNGRPAFRPSLPAGGRPPAKPARRRRPGPAGRGTIGP